MGQICDQEKIVVFTSKEAVILNNNSFSGNESDVLKIVKRQKQTGVYVFNEAKEQKVISARYQNENIDVWHRRLIHKNPKILKMLYRTAVSFPKLKGNLQIMPSVSTWQGDKEVVQFKF